MNRCDPCGHLIGELPWSCRRCGGKPLDMNADGMFEDVNGNGRKDFADVMLYFNQMTWIAANEPLAAFD